jgi:hypothetical protein
MTEFTICAGKGRHQVPADPTLGWAICPYAGRAPLKRSGGLSRSRFLFPTR